MLCDEISERLSALIDGELDASERETVLAHVSTCARCARDEAELRALDRDLDAALEPERARGRDVASAAAARLGAFRPRRFSTLALVAAAAAGFLVAVLVQQALRSERWGERIENAAPVATLDLAVGGLERLAAPGAAWNALPTGASIASGAEIRCGAKTKASFQLADGSELRLNRGARVRFVDARHVALEEGQLFVRVSPAKPGGREFRVDAPGETRVIALGTQLDVLALNQGARLVTLQGLAKIVDGHGASRDVRVGEQAEVRAGAVGNVTPAQALDLMTTWHVELLSLRGRDDAELQAIVNKLLAQLGRTKMENLFESEIRSLGSHCQLPLARYVESDDSKKDEARRADAARILADVADASMRDDFLALLSDPQADVRFHAARALARILGPEWSYPPELWRDSPPAERETATTACKTAFGAK